VATIKAVEPDLTQMMQNSKRRVEWMGNYDAMMEYSKNLMMDPVMGVMGNIYPKF